MSRERHIAEAEAVDSAEGNIIDAAMRGVEAPPWSKTSSRTKGTRRNLGDLMSGRASRAEPVRVGKARSRSRR